MSSEKKVYVTEVKDRYDDKWSIHDVHEDLQDAKAICNHAACSFRFRDLRIVPYVRKVGARPLLVRHARGRARVPPRP